MEKDDTRRKVLIIDDEPNVRCLSHIILKNKFDVLKLKTGVKL